MLEEVECPKEEVNSLLNQVKEQLGRVETKIYDAIEEIKDKKEVEDLDR